MFNQLSGSSSVMWLGARRVADSWKWTDISTFDFQEIAQQLCSKDPCCGLLLIVGQGLMSYSTCDTRTARKVCRLANEASNSKIEGTIKEFESKVNTSLLSQHQLISEAVTNLTSNLNRLSEESDPPYQRKRCKHYKSDE